jgi:hypothetical protein
MPGFWRRLGRRTDGRRGMSREAEWSFQFDSSV